MKDLHAAEWEELARREPYFRVLTHEGDATAAFFESGEADIAALLAAIASLLGQEASLTSTLDFGCGVGRLTLPLARRATKVVACDIAPTMLAHAQQNVRDAGLQNVTFIESSELPALATGEFTFVCSLLVLQYIPPEAGYEIIRTLLRVLATGGVAALHVTLARRSRLARAASTMARNRSARQRDAHLEMYRYNEDVVHKAIEATGTRLLGQFATPPGAVLVIEKKPLQAAHSHGYEQQSKTDDP